SILRLCAGCPDIMQWLPGQEAPVFRDDNDDHSTTIPSEGRPIQAMVDFRPGWWMYGHRFLSGADLCLFFASLRGPAAGCGLLQGSSGVALGAAFDLVVGCVARDGV